VSEAVSEIFCASSGSLQQRILELQEFGLPQVFPDFVNKSWL